MGDKNKFELEQSVLTRFLGHYPSSQRPEFIRQDPPAPDFLIKIANKEFCLELTEYMPCGKLIAARKQQDLVLENAENIAKCTAPMIGYKFLVEFGGATETPPRLDECKMGKLLATECQNFLTKLLPETETVNRSPFQLSPELQEIGLKRVWINQLLIQDSADFGMRRFFTGMPPNLDQNILKKRVDEKCKKIRNYKNACPGKNIALLIFAASPPIENIIIEEDIEEAVDTIREAHDQQQDKFDEVWFATSSTNFSPHMVVPPSTVP